MCDRVGSRTRVCCVTMIDDLVVARCVCSTVWQVERRNRNAEVIADRAGKIYDKFVGFINDMEEIGNRISKTRQAYDSAMNKMTLGNGNIVKQLQGLKDLGARTSKSISSERLGDIGQDSLPAPEINPT